MSSSAASTNPFGEYLRNKFHLGSGRRPSWVVEISRLYREFDTSSSARQFCKAAAELAGTVDSSLDNIRDKLSSSVEFGTFRGYLLEEITLKAAQVALNSTGVPSLEAIKLPTGDGFVTGANLKFSRKRVPPSVEMTLRRDREDVVIGFRRDIVISGDDGTQAKFSNQIIPVCAIACKVYIDATRLENVLAKARGMYTQYPACYFLVLSEWDALGAEWHDDRGQGVLESLFAPVSEMIFLRGDDVRRPKNEELTEKSRQHPIRADKLMQLIDSTQSALGQWKGVKTR